jgi:hypothetical protein
MELVGHFSFIVHILTISRLVTISKAYPTLATINGLTTLSNVDTKKLQVRMNVARNVIESREGS